MGDVGVTKGICVICGASIIKTPLRTKDDGWLCSKACAIRAGVMPAIKPKTEKESRKPRGHYEKPKGKYRYPKPKEEGYCGAI